MVSCTVKTTKCQNALFLKGTWFLGSGSELLIILGFMPYIFTPSWDVSWIPVLLQFKIRCFSFPLSLEEYTFLCKHTNLGPICIQNNYFSTQLLCSAIFSSTTRFLLNSQFESDLSPGSLWTTFLYISKRCIYAQRCIKNNS